MQAWKQFVTQRSRLAVGLALALLVGLILAFPMIVQGRETEVAARAPENTAQDPRDLELGMSDTPDPVPAGEELFYTIFFTVTGNQTATNVVITDSVPANTTYVSATCSPPPCGEAGGVVDWTFAEAPPGRHQASMTVLVASPLVSGTLLTNQAWIHDDAGEHATDSETTRVESQYTLDLVKADLVDPVQAGALLTYVLTYQITGNGIAQGVVITDTVPDHTTYVDQSCSPQPCDLAGNVVTWERGTLPPDSYQASMTVLVDSPLVIGTLLTNQARIHDNSGEQATDSETTMVESQYTLDLAKAGLVDPVQAGALLTYVLTYQATGNGIAEEVTIADTVPPSTTYVSESCSPLPCDETDGVVTWTLDTVPPGGQVIMTVLVDSPLLSGTLLVNEASISDKDGHQDTATASTTVNGEPNLTVSKTVTPGMVRPQGTVTYTITVENTGNGVATGVTVEDQLPTGFSAPSTVWTDVTVHTQWTQPLVATVQVTATDGTYENEVTVTWDDQSTGTEPTAPVLVDGTSPTSRITDYPDITNQTPIPIHWQTSDEIGSGVEQTCLWYKLAGILSWTSSGLCSSAASGVFDFTPPDSLSGTLHFWTVAVDQLGNTEPEPTDGSPYQTLLDKRPPESQAESPDTSPPGTPIEVTWTASDTQSGVDNVVLWYKHGGTGNWIKSDYLETGLSGNPVQGQFDFVPTDGLGEYYFETVATDKADNVEARRGGSGDTHTVVAHSYVYLPIIFKQAEVSMKGSTKTADQVVTEPGQVLDYTIVLSNSGSVWADFAFYDPIPAHTSFGSVDEPCTFDSEQKRIEWTGLLAPHLTATCRYSLRVNADATGSITNTAKLFDGFAPQPIELTEVVSIPFWHRGQDLPQDEMVYSVASCPTHCNVLFAGTRQQGVWKSTNGGQSWNPSGLDGQMVRSLAIGPQCQVLYATTWGSGVWKSTDGGSSWKPFNTDLGDLYLYSVAMGNGDTVYVGTSAAGVYRSDNAGATWQPKSSGMPSSALVYTLVVDPANPQIVYAGTWESGVFRSDNRAESWTAMNAGFAAPMNIFGLAVQPVAPGTLYAATEQHGLYRWSTSTEQWVNEWDTRPIAYSVAVDRAGTAYLGTDAQNGDGIWRRSAAGEWQPLWTQPEGDPAVRAIIVAQDVCAPGWLLWLGTSNGTWWYGVE